MTGRERGREEGGGEREGERGWGREGVGERRRFFFILKKTYFQFLSTVLLFHFFSKSFV